MPPVMILHIPVILLHTPQPSQVLKAIILLLKIKFVRDINNSYLIKPFIDLTIFENAFYIVQQDDNSVVIVGYYHLVKKYFRL